MGVIKVGDVWSTISGEYDFGRSTKSNFNAVRGEWVYQFSHVVEVMFGNKGENLTCRDFLNGKVVGSATIRFDRH